MEAGLANDMVRAALSDCAEARFSGDVGRIRKALLGGDCSACAWVSQALCAPLSKYLRHVLPGVRAVYQYHPPAGPTDGPTDPRAGAAVHLALWMDDDHTAQPAIVRDIESALARSRRRLGCPKVTPDCFTVDIHFMDETDVRQRRGLAGLLADPALMKPIWRGDKEEVEDASPMPASRPAVELPEPFEPELIPEEKLIEYALRIEGLPAQERAPLDHHLTQLKVTLIRRLISDHLDYINVAKRSLTVEDLADIFRRRIGHGRIGGKSAGMLLAGRILETAANQDIKAHIHVPESYFIGSDGMYIFMAMNGLTHWTDQKYKPEKEIRDDYSQIREEFAGGDFPPEMLDAFQDLLEAIGPCPLIVRSSSQLEDSLGTSFAGKYDSFFCPNQGTAEDNLRDLTRAIALTYASTFRADPLLYRRSKGLQDYDERMAVLIQQVQGERWGDAYFPFAAGVAFSRNFYRWAPQIRREDGFMRLVWGLGTRAVERVGNDYPRIVALSHPTLHPDDTPDAIRRYSQQFVDVIDMDANRLVSKPVHEVLTHDYPPLRFMVELADDGYLRSPMGLLGPSEIPKTVVTFDGLLRLTPLASTMRALLAELEKHYGVPVDVEFTLRVDTSSGEEPGIGLAMLQCRPLSQISSSAPAHLPEDLADEDVVLSTRFMVPQGRVTGIRHVVFVEPDAYSGLASPEARAAVTAAISQLNAELDPKTFICVGPGRWGSTNPDLGISVDYADICNAGALIELSGIGVGAAPDPSLGTHFFQDLMEAEIYPLALPLEDPENSFRWEFFYATPNALSSSVGVDHAVEGTLRLLDVAAFRPGHHIDLVMDSDRNRAVAYLVPDQPHNAAKSSQES